MFNINSVLLQFIGLLLANTALTVANTYLVFRIRSRLHILDAIMDKIDKRSLDNESDIDDINDNTDSHVENSYHDGI